MQLQSAAVTRLLDILFLTGVAGVQQWWTGVGGDGRWFVPPPPERVNAILEFLRRALYQQKQQAILQDE